MNWCILAALSIIGAPSAALSLTPVQPHPPRLLSGHQAKIVGLCFSPDGRTLVSSSLDGTVRLWAVDSGALLRTWKVAATRAVFSPDGRLLATASGHSTLRVWEVASGRLARAVSFRGARIESLCFWKNKPLLAAADARGNQVLLVDTRSWRVARRLKGDPPTETRRGPEFSADASIRSACFSPDGRFLATEHQDSSTDGMGVHFDSWIRIWDTTTWRRTRKLDTDWGARSHLDTFAIAPDSRRLFGMITNGTGASLLVVCDLGTGRTEQIGEYDGFCEGLAFAEGGRRIVAGMSGDDAVSAYALVLDAASGQELGRVATDSVARETYYRDPSSAREATGTLAVSPAGDLVATVSPSHRIRLWPVAELLAALRR